MLYSSSYRAIALVCGSGRNTKVIVNGAFVAPKMVKELPNLSIALCSSQQNVVLLEKHGISAVHLDPGNPIRVREGFVNEGEDGVNPTFTLVVDEGVSIPLSDDPNSLDALVLWGRHYRVPLDIRLHHLVPLARQRLAALKEEGKLSGFTPVHKVAERKD